MKPEPRRHSKLRKYAIILGLCGLFAPVGPAFGQRIHAVLIADSKDPNIGPFVSQDSSAISMLLSGNVPQGQLNIQTVSGDQVSTEGILAKIREVPVTAGVDTLLVYFSGHGAYDPTTNRSYFQIPRLNQALFRDQVRQAVLARQPRLGVIITDTCNVRVKVPQAFAPMAAFANIQQLSPLLISLLLQPTGLVDVSATRPGQAGFAGPQVQDGSLFTRNLAEVMRGHMQEELDWRTLLGMVDQQTNAEFDQLNPGGWNIPELGLLQQDHDIWVLSLPDQGGGGDNGGGGNGGGGGGMKQGFRFGVRAVNNGGDGVRITEVFADSPAAAAGLEPGDVIVAINGRRVSDEAAYSAAVDASDQVMVTDIRNVRDGQMLRMNITLGGGDGGGGGGGNPPPANGLVFGARAINNGGDGVRITEVFADSPAAGVGFEPGDVIVAINGRRIDSEAAYSAAIDASPATMSYQVRNVRDGQLYNGSIRLNK